MIPVLLLLWGCAEKPSAPSPPAAVKPANFWQFTWNQVDWHLVSGRVGQIIAEDLPVWNAPHFPPRDGWFTMYRKDQPRFLFQIRSGILTLYSRSQSGLFEVFCHVDFPLAPGKTWHFGSLEAICGTGQIQTMAGIYDAIGVHFKESGKLLHTMWFDQKEGLVQWDGIEAAPISRATGSSVQVQLQWAAFAYPQYGRVDDDLRAASLDCKAPVPQLRMSASRDGSAHGRKHYYLYAKDRPAYLHAKDVDQPDGQILVKESWIPGDERRKGPLFLMLKSQGDWIYATATPEGSTLTASGKLASCIECHESASTRDRMFGLTSCAAAK